MPKGTRTEIKLVGADVVLTTSDGNQQMMSRLEALDIAAKDFQPLMEQFGAYVVDDHIAKQFKKQGTPKRWAPLSKRYEKWKRDNYGNLPKLILTERMSKGFKYQATPRTLKIINRVTAGQGKNKTPRWIWHQDGTETMPARPMLQLGKRDYAVLIKLAHKHLLFDEGAGL